MSGIWYATVEQVLGGLEITSRARATSLVKQKLELGSRAVESLTNRRFYPERRTVKVDWPNYGYAPPWAINMWDNEFAVLYTVTAGGQDIPVANCIPRRGDDKLEPPYNRLEIDLSSGSAFAAGPGTFQQAIEIEALFTGDKDTDTTLAGGALGGSLNGSATSVAITPSSGVLTVGIGSLLLVGTERMVVVDRQMADTGVTITGSVAANKGVTTVPVSDGTKFAFEEVIYANGERMRVDDIIGNNLTVTRAWDGTVLAAHTNTEAVYAKRTCTLRRGVLGSTASTHSASDPVYVHEYPGPVTDLCIAETVTALEQNASAYARTVGSGSTQRAAPGQGLEDLRNTCYSACGRKGRLGSI
jgi:hypothetical protein